MILILIIKKLFVYLIRVIIILEIMKTKLTQSECSLYFWNNFAKSRIYPNKLITLEYGTYVIIEQAVVIASCDLSANYELDDSSATLMRQTIANLKTLTRFDCENLRQMLPHWQFFETQFENKPLNSNLLQSKFRAAFPFEDKSSKNFYTKLTHWTGECGYSINIKGFFNNKTIAVSR